MRKERSTTWPAAYKRLLFLAGVLLLVALAGCTGSKPALIEGAERDQVLAQAEPIADRVFQGMSEHNFARFSQDFDATMQKAMPETGFTKMMQTIDPKIGKYQSRQVVKVEKVGKYVAVTYTAKHEQEDAVAWRIVLAPGDPMRVSGLWYDSPKLRGSK